MEANNPLKYWKMFYFFVLAMAVYVAIGGTIVLMQNGYFGMGVATFVCAVFMIIKMKEKVR